MNAPKPNVFFGLPSLQKDVQISQSEASEEEKSLYQLTQQRGWEILSKFIDELSKDLDSINRTAISSGLPFEEIGRNTIVISMAQDIISKIKNKVSDAKDAVEKNNEQ